MKEIRDLIDKTEITIEPGKGRTPKQIEEKT